jgi:hypothetical protein
MRSLLTGLLFVFCFFARPAAAQPATLLPAARYLTSFPFRMLNGGIIVAKGRIGDFPDSLNFIFDTGNGGISLDSATAQYLRLTPVTSDLFIHGIAGIRPQRLVRGLTLHLPGISLDSLSIKVSDYDVLSCVYGEKIDGIIGYGFFSRYLVKIDYDSSKIFVYTRGLIHYPKGGFLLHPNLSSLPMQMARLNETRDVTSRFYFDTGGGLCLLLSSSFTADSIVFGSRKRKPVRTEAAGLGGKAEMKLTTLKTFSLGPFQFHQVPTYIFDDVYQTTNYPQLAGLIGNDLLRRFNLILNYERSEIYLVPNASFDQPFDYSYSGLEISKVQGEILVTAVMNGSPAEKAAFQEGDIILGIDGETHQDLASYQELLRTVGPKLRVRLKRKDGSVTTLFLRVKSIL